MVGQEGRDKYFISIMIECVRVNAWNRQNLVKDINHFIVLKEMLGWRCVFSLVRK